MPEISVVVPVYKVEPYLKRCVDSILSQSYTDFQLILVDDGSPDNCGKICDEYAEKDSRIHVIHRENGGLSAARNSGIDWVFDHSYTEWITFIDSDDWVSSRYLEKLHKAAEEYLVNISIGGFISVSDNNLVDDTQDYKAEKYSPEKLWSVNRGNATVAWGKLYRTDLFMELRYPEGRIHEDEFTTYKLLFNQEFVAYCSDKLYRYYLSPNSIMRSKWSIRLLDGVEALEQQMLFFKAKKNKLALSASEKAHMHTVFYLIKKINTSETTKEHMELLNNRLSDFLCQYYKCRLFQSTLFGRLYLYKTKCKTILVGKYHSLKNNLIRS